MNDARLHVRDFAGCLLVTTNDDIGVELAGRFGALAGQPSCANIVLNLRGGCVIDREATAALAELRNALEVNGGSLRIALPGERSRAVVGADSGLSGCIYEDLADAIEVSMAVRADRSVPRATWVDPRWR